MCLAYGSIYMVCYNSSMLTRIKNALSSIPIANLIIVYYIGTQRDCALNSLFVKEVANSSGLTDEENCY